MLSSYTDRFYRKNIALFFSSIYELNEPSFSNIIPLLYSCFPFIVAGFTGRLLLDPPLPLVFMEFAFRFRNCTVIAPISRISVTGIQVFSPFENLKVWQRARQLMPETKFRGAFLVLTQNQLHLTLFHDKYNKFKSQHWFNIFIEYVL